MEKPLLKLDPATGCEIVVDGFKQPAFISGLTQASHVNEIKRAAKFPFLISVCYEEMTVMWNKGRIWHGIQVCSKYVTVRIPLCYTYISICVDVEREVEHAELDCPYSCPGTDIKHSPGIRHRADMQGPIMYVNADFMLKVCHFGSPVSFMSIQRYHRILLFLSCSC